MLNPQSVLMFSAFLFCAGLYGVLSRRNLIMLLMSLELTLNAVNISLVTYSRYWAGQGSGLIQAHTGQFFTLMVMAVAAAEVGIGLAIIVAVYRRLRTADTDAATSLRN
ncbi:NADH-quinone oxidoreductase subunit NuoK [Planctomycetota bacterium]|nr:NADH-quinone oxidoreductase subunit NuoK [Planctomycetota bacterium]